MVWKYKHGLYGHYNKTLFLCPFKPINLANTNVANGKTIANGKTTNSKLMLPPKDKITLQIEKRKSVLAKLKEEVKDNVNVSNDNVKYKK